MRILTIAAALVFALTAFAHADTATIHIENAKARPTAPGMKTGVVYMLVMNHGDADDTLNALSTPVADRAEMHRTVIENGIGRMDAVASLPIKANGAETFEPRGLHVMLMGLKQQLKPGDTFKLVLTFAKAGAVETTVAVEAGGKPAKPMDDMPGMKM